MDNLPNALETEPTPTAENRQGFALAGALLALVVVGALVTGSFYAASQEQSIGLSSKYNDQALYVAETALNREVGKLSIAVLDTLTAQKRLRDTLNPIVVNGDTVGKADVWVRRIAGTTADDRFLFVSRATATRGGSRGGGQRIVGLVTQIMRAQFPANSAMLLYDGIQVKGSSLVNGADMYPTGSGYPQWGDCTTTSEKAGVITRTGTTASANGGATIQGNPPVQTQALDSSAFLRYGAFDYDYIASMATKVYPGGTLQTQPSVLNGACNTADVNNWGEPGSADNHVALVPECQNYWPIIHSVGKTNTLHLSGGGRGQGVLLVDGDLDISGGFDFWGVVVVKGKLSSSGTGGHIYGTVLSFGQGDLYVDPAVVVGNSVVNFSSCAIAKATANMDGMNYAMPIKAHAWVDLTAAGAGY